MSIFSSDHAVMPENDEIVEAVEATETVEIEAEAQALVEADTLAEAEILADEIEGDDFDEESEEPAEPTITFADLGLPEASCASSRRTA